MTECRHGMKSGCVYCHAAAPVRATQPLRTGQRRRPRGTRLSEQMNERMTALKRRLKELRGE